MRRARLIALALLALVLPSLVQAADKAQLLIGVGQYDILPDDNKSAALHIQYRLRRGLGQVFSVQTSRASSRSLVAG
jgi:hypothetical protein